MPTRQPDAIKSAKPIPIPSPTEVELIAFPSTHWNSLGSCKNGKPGVNNQIIIGLCHLCAIQCHAVKVALMNSKGPPKFSFMDNFFFDKFFY